MINAFLEHATRADRLVAGLSITGFATAMHGAAYNAAEGALRLQRTLLKRGADLVAIAGLVEVIRIVAG